MTGMQLMLRRIFTWPQVPTIDLLGIHPHLQGIGVQPLMAAVVVTGFARSQRLGSTPVRHQ